MKVVEVKWEQNERGDWLLMTGRAIVVRLFRYCDEKGCSFYGFNLVQYYDSSEARAAVESALGVKEVE